MKQMSLSKLNWRLFLFGLFKIPLIRFCRPRVAMVSAESIDIRIPLKRRTRNHVGSMYLGVMSIGADLASGFLAYYLLEIRGLKASPVFGGMRATYLKRAEADVHFVCSEGGRISEMIAEAQQSKERVTEMIKVQALCMDELVAEFEMDLSFRVN